jgi:cell division protease FtsH
LQKIKEFLRKNKRLSVAGAAIIIFMISFAFMPDKDPKEVSLSRVYELVTAKQVESAVLYDEDHSVVVKLKDKTEAPNGMVAKFVAESSDEVQERFDNTGIKLEVDRSNEGLISTIFTSFWVWFILFYVVLFYILPKVMHRMTIGAVSGNTDFVSERPTERFSDVKGAEEAIEELSLYVDRLTDPDGMSHLKLEQGIILHGPTGTGKTMLAKALAGQAGVEFHRLSGAALTSVYQNGTSTRVRELFSNVKKRLKNPNAPAVVFIDEIDGVAVARESGLNKSEDRNSGVTALLHEIGVLFEQHPNVVVIAATNRLHALDDALKRPGRLGLHIAMPDPDRAVREQILRTNSTGLKFAHEDFDGLAGLTAHLSGASVAAVPRTAARIAHMRAKRAKAAGSDEKMQATILWNDLEQATMEVTMGKLLVTKRVTDEDRALSAVHESGHTILAQASPYHRPMIATVYPIKESGGSTWFVMDDNTFHTLDVLRWMLALDMGGRAAERLVFGDEHISNGAGHDLQMATKLALSAVCTWGIFSDFPTEIDVESWMEHPDAAKINEKVTRLIKEGETLALAIIERDVAFRKALTSNLLAKKILHSKELSELAAEHNAQQHDRAERLLEPAA